MRDPQRPPVRLALAATILILLGLALLLGACGRSRTGNGGGTARADSVHASDSTAVADSAAADSLADRGRRRGGLLGFLGRGASEESGEDEEEDAVPVRLATVERQDVPLYLSATATLEPEKAIEIMAKGSGQIREIRVEEGDYVQAGQLLALLDGEAERVALEEATVRADGLKRELERSRAMYTQQGISDREMQDIQTRWEEADAQRQAAELRWQYTRILAPFAGTISERYVDPGQHVTAGIRVFGLVDADPLLARIYLPEREAVSIAPLQETMVTPDTHPDLELPGRVLRVAPIVDTRTGTVKVTCQVRDTSERVRPGSFVRIRVQTDLHSQVPVIPKRALVPEGGENYVFKVMADSVIKVGIETGFVNGRYVEICGGLELGDRVVTVGQGSLKTGTKIQDLEAPTTLADSTTGKDETP
ncbi:MAG: efflux RND transporter periplasmic adaptor subunit [Candidatus Krumholzibacteriota bacterium]|nr:efflux RND transporter periplasmic adaptor subunit [Candidatus Krumholzibacteriota bacterium]